MRYTRADNIPDAEVRSLLVLMFKILNVVQPDEEGNLPAVRDYHAINSVPTNVRVPKKVATPVRVEGKVWFANERSAYLSLSAFTECSQDMFRQLG